ncbi:MAG: restriction endonuclease subunit S [Coriobacteriales bacterium]|nr:restriction endonuclease subunit S [Coriobacteriales bacterium]
MKAIKLRDITVQITDGKHGDCKNENSSGYYFVSCKDVFDGSIHYEQSRQITKDDCDSVRKRVALEPGDTVITNSGTIGRMAFATDKPETYNTAFQKSVAVVKPNKDLVEPKYLYYLLLSCVADMARNSNGSAQKNLLLSAMREYELSFHESKDSQRRLVNILTTYDNLIENNRRQIALLEEAAQRLYKEWFIDLRFPGHEDVKIVDGVPEGWHRIYLKECITIMSGGTPKTSNPANYDGDIPFFTPGDCTSSIWAFDTNKHISEQGLNNCNSKLFPEGTTILTARGTVGNTVLLGTPMAMNQSCFALKFSALNYQYFLYYTICGKVAELKARATGGVFDTIVLQSFDSLLVVIPNEQLIRDFESIASSFLKDSYTLGKQIVQLIKARDRLLPKLISSEIDVSNFADAVCKIQANNAVIVAQLSE